MSAMFASDDAVEEWETYIEEAIAASTDHGDLIARLRATIREARRREAAADA